MVNFITVRYVPLYESSRPRLPAKSCNSRNRGGRVLFFTGSSLYVGGRPAFQHPLLSPPPTPRRSLLADPVDRVHAWHLSSEIPLFRRETNENHPRRRDLVAFATCLPHPSRLFRSTCARARSRCFCPFLSFPSRHPRSPFRPLVLTCDLIRSFSRAALRLLDCLARCVCACASAASKFCTRRDSASLCASLYSAEVHTVSYTVNYFAPFSGQFLEKKKKKRRKETGIGRSR